MPDALDYATDNCTLIRTLEVVGERWTLVVLREVFVGVRRFDDIRRHTGMPRQVLTDRLRRLCERGILERTPYREPGSRERHEYHLTQRGLGLRTALIALTQWGDAHLADADGPPIAFVHRECRRPIVAALRCADGHEVDDARSVTWVPGPGAHPANRVAPRT